MNKLVLSLAAVAVLFAADASARCCARERSCGERACHVRPVEACCEPVAPICKVPCVTYRQVPAIRHVSYSCPTSCLTEQTFEGHVEKIKAMHTDAGIEVEVIA